MLYIHIPFCKQACYYCDFHFSTNLEKKASMITSLCREMEIRKDYLQSNVLETIYFGGGTPSLLTANDLKILFKNIRSNFIIAPDAEITLEANPDDLSIENLSIFQEQGINRLSIGVQSFDANHLKFMNRAHNSDEAYKCIESAKKLGFDNLSLDIIYGIPAESHQILERDLSILHDFGINHISAYCLTVEPKTIFGNWVKTKKMAPIDDQFASEQFEIVMGKLSSWNYEQYEISNFARNNAYSKHNASYWKGKPYLGIGPSAHSFNGESRQNNIANNSAYLKGIVSNSLNFEAEILTIQEKTNEYLMTTLRTSWGANIDQLNSLSDGLFSQKNQTILQKYIDKNWLIMNQSNITITHSGKFFVDLIASDLFIE